MIRLDETHNEALLALVKVCSSPEELFHTDRRPDFFALSRELGDAMYYGILKNELLIASVAVTAQLRILSGNVATVHYIHDLRVHPQHRGSRVFYELIRGLQEMYSEAPGWLYGIVLGTNPFAREVSVKRTLFPEVKRIGTIVHTGFPLFCGTNRSRHCVHVISADEAWSFYKEQTKALHFAWADATIFRRPNGSFLGVTENGILVSACKIIDQDYARKIVRSQPVPFAEQLVNTYCRLRGRMPLPDKHETLRHLHLSYYVSSAGDYRTAYAAYVRAQYAHQYSYLFAGMTESEAVHYNNPFLVKFHSQVYTYGKAPSFPFQFPELTLI